MNSVIVAMLLLAAGSPRPVADIRDVDFYNFTFPAFAGFDEVPVKNGDYCGNLVPGDDLSNACIGVGPVMDGDLTGDGIDETVVFMGAVFRSGNGSPGIGYVYTLRDGRPVLIYTLASGDRHHSGILSVDIVDGNLVVTRLEGADRYQAIEETTTFHWNGTTFVPIAVTQRHHRTPN